MKNFLFFEKFLKILEIHLISINLKTITISRYLSILCNSMEGFLKKNDICVSITVFLLVLYCIYKDILQMLIIYCFLPIYLLSLTADIIMKNDLRKVKTMTLTNPDPEEFIRLIKRWAIFAILVFSDHALKILSHVPIFSSFYSVLRTIFIFWLLNNSEYFYDSIITYYFGKYYEKILTFQSWIQQKYVNYYSKFNYFSKFI